MMIMKDTDIRMDGEDLIDLMDTDHVDMDTVVHTYRMALTEIDGDQILTGVIRLFF